MFCNFKSLSLDTRSISVTLNMDGRAAMTTSNVEEFDWFLRFSIATQARNIRPLPASMQSFYGNIRVKGVIHSLSVCL